MPALLVEVVVYVINRIHFAQEGQDLLATDEEVFCLLLADGKFLAEHN